MIDSASHRPDSNRACVHLLTRRPPPVCRFNRAAVGRLSFQPQVTAAPQPVIASRVGDVLTVAFDIAGAPAERVHPGPAGVFLVDRAHRGNCTAPHRWRYQLAADPTNPDLVIGTLVEEAP